MANANLTQAKRAKKDEFYTQYSDIEREVNAYLDFNPKVFQGKTVLLPCDDPEWSNFTKFFAQNFQRLGLRKLISTSYAPSADLDLGNQLSLFDEQDPRFDEDKQATNGRIFTLDRDTTGDARVDIHDLEWDYLSGDGDFRSPEVVALRDQSDIVVTNPPFSLFREFLAWLLGGNKQFLMVGSMNAITYKETFPLIKNNQMWLGNGFSKGDAYFRVPDSAKNDYAPGVYNENTKLVHFRNVTWFTNLDHGRRHEPLPLMTETDNIKFSRHKAVKNVGYTKYDNYDAIEVPFTDAIPSDYTGAMGVPISFLDKYCPEQFEILGLSASWWEDQSNLRRKHDKKHNPVLKGNEVYRRLFIRHIKENKK